MTTINQLRQMPVVELENLIAQLRKQSWERFTVKKWKEINKLEMLAKSILADRKNNETK